MGRIPDSVKDTIKGQKWLSWGIIAAILGAGVMVFNAVAPPLILMFKNIWLLVIWGGPWVAAAMIQIMFPGFWWGLARTLAWKVVQFFIKMDPISVLERYLEYLQGKKAKLDAVIVTLKASEVKMARKIAEKKESSEKNLSLGQAAVQQGDQLAASKFGMRYKTDQQSIALFSPILDRINKNLAFLNKLRSNWQESIESLSYSIDAKKDEFETLSVSAEGIKASEAFLKQDPQYKLYMEGLKQLENQVTQNIAAIDDFESRTQDIMRSLQVESTAKQNEGLAAIEEFSKNKSLEMPNFTQLLGKIAVDAELAPVTNKKFSFQK